MSTSKRKPQRPQPVPCQPLTRVHYFTGQMLSVADFTAEQDYVREKLRRHNRSLHQPGIIDGLEVTLQSPGVRVAPGFALDAAGNEICVPVAQEVPLPGVAREVYLVLRYAEIGVTPVPVPGVAGADTTDTLPLRTQESFALDYEAPGSPPSPAPPIRLARLRGTRGRWRLDAWFRRTKAR